MRWAGMWSVVTVSHCFFRHSTVADIRSWRNRLVFAFQLPYDAREPVPPLNFPGVGSSGSSSAGFGTMVPVRWSRIRSMAWCNSGSTQCVDIFVDADRASAFQEILPVARWSTLRFGQWTASTPLWANTKALGHAALAFLVALVGLELEVER
ncbi:hypothetical protein MMC17_001867 [Xylographa soralifera]|nr:hypothetical protein [Xylographa soralifera]